MKSLTKELNQMFGGVARQRELGALGQYFGQHFTGTNTIGISGAGEVRPEREHQLGDNCIRRVKI